jgi:hypothetical protein
LSIKKNEKRGEDEGIMAEHVAKLEPVSSDRKEQCHPNKEDEDLPIESLNKITERNKEEYYVAKLPRTDILRTSDLYKDYNKLKKYSKIITGADQQSSNLLLKRIRKGIILLLTSTCSKLNKKSKTVYRKYFGWQIYTTWLLWD